MALFCSDTHLPVSNLAVLFWNLALIERLQVLFYSQKEPSLLVLLLEGNTYNNTSYVLTNTCGGNFKIEPKDSR